MVGCGWFVARFVASLCQVMARFVAGFVMGFWLVCSWVFAEFMVRLGSWWLLCRGVVVRETESWWWGG